MRILVHDYAGHAFPVQLSRALAARGHEVRHAFCWSTLTPRGELDARLDDSPTLTIEGIDLGRMIAKYSFIDRFKLEVEYGRRLLQVCREFEPEVILSGQNPTMPQHRLARYCQRNKIRLVSWIQDMYGVAAHRVLKDKYWGLGGIAGQAFIKLDKRSALMSDQIVVITEDFVPIFESYGVPSNRIHVIHNWAPIDSLPLLDRDNSWATENASNTDCRFVYSGTLSVKHNPALLLRLAQHLDAQNCGELIVISEGTGIDWLREQVAQESVKRIRLMPFQPFDKLAEVLAAGDILIAILEPGSGSFCVPSKILSYMCAGRPLLGAMPPDNLASQIIERAQVGLSCGPEDVDGFLAAADRLMKQEGLRSEMGESARNYAEQNFDIEEICDRFETILGTKQ